MKEMRKNLVSNFFDLERASPLDHQWGSFNCGSIIWWCFCSAPWTEVVALLGKPAKKKLGRQWRMLSLEFSLTGSLRKSEKLPAVIFFGILPNPPERKKVISFFSQVGVKLCGISAAQQGFLYLPEKLVGSKELMFCRKSSALLLTSTIVSLLLNNDCWDMPIILLQNWRSCSSIVPVVAVILTSYSGMDTDILLRWAELPCWSVLVVDDIILLLLRWAELAVVDDILLRWAELGCWSVTDNGIILLRWACWSVADWEWALFSYQGRDLSVGLSILLLFRTFGVSMNCSGYKQTESIIISCLA